MPIGRPRWFFQIDGGFFAVVDGGFFRTWAARLHFGKIPKKFGQIWRKFSKILAKFAKFWKKTAKNSAIFNENFEIRERCKGVHCVDLGESFPTHLYLQNLASIQPRTSPIKFACSPCTDPPGSTTPRAGRTSSPSGISGPITPPSSRLPKLLESMPRSRR